MLAEKCEKVTKTPGGRPRSPKVDEAVEIYSAGLERGDSRIKAWRLALNATGVPPSSLRSRLVSLGIETPPMGRPPTEVTRTACTSKSVEEIQHLLIDAGIGLSEQWDMRRQTIKAGRAVLMDVSVKSIVARGIKHHHIDGPNGKVDYAEERVYAVRIPEPCDGDEDDKFLRRAILSAVALGFGRRRGLIWFPPGGQGAAATCLAIATKMMTQRKARMRADRRRQRYLDKMSRAAHEAGS